MTAEEVVARLGLKPHPEGGFYQETFRDDASTAIYYLLREGDRSAWHRVTHAAEVWHYYAGAPLELCLSEGRGRQVIRLGMDLASGEEPQAVVPPGVWQSARPLGGWVLVGCTVAPGFEFASFEMAPPGWEPE
ncbi:MAG TPA: cupin domain-containing protein [Thermoanaerobaculia bacterium]|jgi:predicted cupin superfamily sugar epimerase|nr:cupin domain-containing protein [Thermoanaerobaculia bacterium]